MFSLLVRALVRLLVLPRAGDGTKDLEILVLRQQLRVLRRQASYPRFTALDRALLAAASRALPRDQWASFLVTPQTLLRWHRELMRRKCTYRKGHEPGRPPIDPEVAALILRWRGRTPDGAVSGSPGSSASSVSGWVPRRSAPCCGEAAWVRRQDAPGPPDAVLRAQAEGIVACDLLHSGDDPAADVVCAVFIELNTRRVLVAGVTANLPGGPGVSQPPGSHRFRA